MRHRKLTKGVKFYTFYVWSDLLSDIKVNWAPKSNRTKRSFVFYKNGNKQKQNGLKLIVFIWNFTSNFARRIYRVSQKKSLSKCCWSHIAPAQSSVPGTPFNQTVSGNFLFGSFLTKTKQVKRFQVMFERKFGHTSLLFLVRIFRLQQQSESHFLGHLVLLCPSSALCHCFLQFPYVLPTSPIWIIF